MTNYWKYLDEHYPEYGRVYLIKLPNGSIHLGIIKDDTFRNCTVIRAKETGNILSTSNHPDYREVMFAEIP